MTSLTGMDRTTGAPISGDAHLAQSIADIITTPIGTRTMRRDYGCLLPELLDRPFNAATRLLCTMAIAIAIARWEPRVTVRRIQIEGEPATGQATVTITAQRTNGAATSLARLTIPLTPIRT